MASEELYAVGDRVVWNTPSNASQEIHGVPTNAAVVVVITAAFNGESYEASADGHGWVSVLPGEISGKAE